MPKKPPRDNPKRRELRTVHTAGAGAAALLQRIKTRAGVVGPGTLPGGPAASAAPRPTVLHGLPESLAPHVLDSLEKEGELVVFTDSAVWAARLKLWLGERDPGTGTRRVTVRIRQQRDKK